MVHITFRFMPIILIYRDGNIHTKRKNTNALIVPLKEIGIEVNADKPK